MKTTAIGEQYQSPFYNQAIRIKQNMTGGNNPDFQENRKKLGRTPESKKKV